MYCRHYIQSPSNVYHIFANNVEFGVQGNEPHHLSVLANGHTLVATGLLSVLKSQDEVFFFEIPDESPCPKFTASFDVPNAAVADDVLALPGGGFLVPMVRMPS